MNRSGYESDSSDTSSENLLEIILAEEEEMRRQRKKKFHAALLLANLTLCVGLEEGNDRTYRERLKWDEHVSLLNKEGPNAFEVDAFVVVVAVVAAAAAAATATAADVAAVVDIVGMNWTK